MKPLLKSSILYFIVAMMTMLYACSDHLGNDEPDSPDKPDAPVEWTQVTAPTAIVGQLPSDELGEALGGRFSNISDLGSAKIAIFSGSSLKSVSVETLRDFYNQGNLIIVVNPDNNTDNVLIEDLGSSYTPYCDNSDVLIYAFNNRDQHYLIFNEQELPRPEVEVEETDISGLENIPDEDGVIEEDENLMDAENEEPHEHDHTYFHNQLEGFIDWVNSYVKENSFPNDENSQTVVGPDGYNPKCDINTNFIQINVGMPFSLHNQVDKGTFAAPDSLNKDGSVDFQYNIIPLYVHNIPGQTENTAGDYYIVDGKMIVHSGNVWGPYKQAHGWCNDRVVGYYLSKAISLVELVDKDDVDELKKSDSWKSLAVSDVEPPVSNHHLSNVQFYTQPVPGTYEGSTDYSETVSYGMDITVSGKYSAKDGPEVGVSAGFSANWSNTVAQSLPDVATQRFTDNCRVKYAYNIMNIFNKRDWDKMDRNYPWVSRSDLEGRQVWIWKVPAGTHGVDEYSNAEFYLKISFRGYYDTYNWWRGASWGYHHTFPTQLGIAAFKIAPPSRIPFGVLAIKNAADETMANIRVTNMKTGKVSEIPSSYGYNETARIKLLTGKYRVDYDIIDPKTHKVVSKWYMENIDVKMRPSEDASTTLISSVNFDEIK